jgi:hypothetical protein
MPRLENFRSNARLRALNETQLQFFAILNDGRIDQVDVGTFDAFRWPTHAALRHAIETVAIRASDGRGPDLGPVDVRGAA